MFEWMILAKDASTAARTGRLVTPHGPVETPAFMPVGTRATVKGLTPRVLRDAGAQILLANTYHLQLRPGAEAVAELGGLHRFMGWSGPILTDSGGYQVFSLAELVQIDDGGVSFRSHIDGEKLRLDPVSAVRIQERLGADIIMAFDECPPYPCPREQVERAVARTLDWAAACKSARQREDQALFGIVQGGIHGDLRRRCAEVLAELDLPGYAVGGLSVGESHDEMMAVLDGLEPILPADRPRYLMGVGMPQDIAAAVARGIDMFDCVLPTRNGRNAYAFTPTGPLRLRNEQYRLDDRPIEPGCDCGACRSFSRGYLRHLFRAEEMLGPMLVSEHNVHFYQRMMRQIRELIQRGEFNRLSETFPVCDRPMETDSSKEVVV
jgi:queuine tRNA-ribosyltransferase